MNRLNVKNLFILLVSILLLEVGHATQDGGFVPDVGLSSIELDSSIHARDLLEGFHPLHLFLAKSFLDGFFPLEKNLCVFLLAFLLRAFGVFAGRQLVSSILDRRLVPSTTHLLQTESELGL